MPILITWEWDGQYTCMYLCILLLNLIIATDMHTLTNTFNKNKTILYFHSIVYKQTVLYMQLAIDFETDLCLSAKCRQISAK